ncbi:TlpA family protein disulfide reductase [Tenuifilum thalassicum]|uniref:TlpA family protein disulfide reductase n=2 Tax=Tenuifilum thalassicum TaxID=2590900 RepID=A0A7D4BJR0_9BACT|nr:TlpA family protein disulfide reductase [Tenuifilum thalassicum]
MFNLKLNIMRKLAILFVATFWSLLVYSQEDIPNVIVKDLQGKKVNIQNVIAEKPLVVLTFWASWCKPCHQELNSIADLYEEWNEETGVEVVAISIDDSRASGKVKSLVAGNDWPFIVLLDENADLKRALNITNVPFLLLFKNGKIVHKHVGYTPGSEMELFEIIKKNTK